MTLTAHRNWSITGNGAAKAIANRTQSNQPGAWDCVGSTGSSRVSVGGYTGTWCAWAITIIGLIWISILPMLVSWIGAWTACLCGQQVRARAQKCRRSSRRTATRPSRTLPRHLLPRRRRTPQDHGRAGRQPSPGQADNLAAGRVCRKIQTRLLGVVSPSAQGTQAI